MPEELYHFTSMPWTDELVDLGRVSANILIFRILTMGIAYPGDVGFKRKTV